jgi:hypothetical protein
MGFKDPALRPGFFALSHRWRARLRVFPVNPSVYRQHGETGTDLSGGESSIDSKRQKKGMQNSALLTRVEIGPGLFATVAESSPSKIFFLRCLDAFARMRTKCRECLESQRFVPPRRPPDSVPDIAQRPENREFRAPTPVAATYVLCIFGLQTGRPGSHEKLTEKRQVI